MTQHMTQGMSRRVFLHVGLPKSGTTYMQAFLTANKEDLKDRAGVLYPGPNYQQHVKAVRDVREMGGPAGKNRGVGGAWPALVKEISAWDGDAIVSMEWLCAADPKHIRRIVDDLSPARVEVVFTVRDLGRTIPAAWQEYMQNRGEWSWAEFLEGVAAEDARATPAGNRFWSQHDLEKLVAKWTEVVPVAQVHVVTLPHPGASPDMLWQRMSEVLGIDASGYAIDTPGNVSLGLESAELMRRLNARARDAGIRKSLYHQVFKHGFAKRVLAERGRPESKLGLPVGYHDWARKRSTQQIEAIEASQVHVVGDLADLRPVLDANQTRQPDDVPDDVLLETCLAGLVTMARQWDNARNAATDLRLENGQLSRRLDRSQQLGEQLGERIRHFESHPVRAALGTYRRRLRRR